MAGEGDVERLIVLFEAKMNDFEKNIAKASGVATKSFAGMRRDSKTATERMEQDMVRSTNSINRALAATSTKIGGFGKSMLAGFAGGLVAGGLAGIVSRLGQVASGVAAIGDEAKRAGIDIKSFQELKYVAEQNRIGVDALTDGMKELSLRADEFVVTGGGSAAEAFQRLGYGAEELNQKLQDPSALFTEIIGKLQSLDRAAQIRIADELFGGSGGEQFVQLIAQGEEGIRRTIDEANNLGIVLDAQVIAKAAEVDRKFNQVANTVGSALKQAIVEATGALVDFMSSLPKSADQQFQDLTVEIDGTKDTLVQLANSAGNLFPELEPQIRDAVVQFLSGKIAAEDAKQALLDIAKGRPDLAPIIGDMNGLISMLEMVMVKAREAAAQVAAATSDPINGGGAPATWENMQSAFFPKPSTVPGSGGRSAAANEAEREAKAVQNLIAGLQFEQELIGLSAVEQAKMNALRQAGAAATDEQRATIGQLVEATYSQQGAFDSLMSTMQMAEQLGTTFTGTLLSDLRQGKDAAEALGDAFGNLAEQLLQMAAEAAIKFLLQTLISAVGGGGGGGGGMSFGGGGGRGIFGFDGGGYTGNAPRSGGVDGKGGFPAILHPRETVVDHTRGQSANSNSLAVVRIELSGEVEGRILEQSGQQSVQIVRAAAPGIAEQGSKGAGSMLAGGDFDRSMSRFGVLPQAKRR